MTSGSTPKTTTDPNAVDAASHDPLVTARRSTDGSGVANSSTAEPGSRTAPVLRHGNFYSMRLPTLDENGSGRTGVRGALVLAVAAMLALTTACADTVGGTAASSSSSTSTTSTPAADAPDPGNYPTTPRAPLGAADTPKAGNVLDAQRLAGYVIGPWEVDPTLVDSYTVPWVITDTGVLESISDRGVADAAGRHDFVNGFASSRQVKDQTILRNTVLRFADPASAAAAATDMSQVMLGRMGSGPTAPVTVPIPGHPDALTCSAPFTPADGKPWLANVTSFTPHGPYVLMQLAESRQSLEQGTDLIAKSLDLQIPLIDQFTPTAPADFPGLPLDPSGLLARTLPAAAKESTPTLNATYDRRGALHFQGDPIASGRLFDDTGMTIATMSRATVYQAADAAGAAKIVDQFAREVAAGGGTTGQPVTGVPGSRCVTIPSLGSYCVASADRYAFEVPAAQLTAVQQMVAAQYLILKTK